MTPTAIITGGSHGFGRALATDLTGAGWHVVLDGRDAAAVDEAARTMGPLAHPVPGDVTDPRHRADLVAAAADLGQLDLLVNNASALGPSPLLPLRSLPEPAFDELLRINVAAPLAMIRLALPVLTRPGGAIVNVTSDAAVEAYDGWGGYGASKAALEQLSHVLAVEEPDLAVWWFDPGDMRTRMHQAAFPDEDISDRPSPAAVAPALRRLLADRPPSGRVRAADLLPAATS